MYWKRRDPARNCRDSGHREENIKLNATDLILDIETIKESKFRTCGTSRKG